MIFEIPTSFFKVFVLPGIAPRYCVKYNRRFETN